MDLSWSLFEKKEDESSDVEVGTGIFGYSGKKLEPLKFSNGKTQEDVVNEVLDKIKKGKKIIFIKGVCGTGKSAIALNLARHFEKTSIVVPIKSLQDQYERDYTQKKFILKGNNKPLKISIIKGRANFPCRFAGERADNPEAPCTIEIKEKNTETLYTYLEENKFTKKEDFQNISDIRRANVAAACPMWSPIMNSDANPKGLGDYRKLKYTAVSGKEYAVFKRKSGCPYYEQYDSYSTSDVIIFNSTKYLIEMEMGRKPKTDLDIIDECDEFLDSFANEKRINLNRLITAVSGIIPGEREKFNSVKEIVRLANEIIYEENQGVKKLRNSKILDLLEKILENTSLAEDEELNYYNHVVEVAKTFEKITDETYCSIEKVKKENGQNNLFGEGNVKEDSSIVTLISINLASKLKELIESNNCLVMMSGTLHSEEVLRDIFGLKDFEIIDAETKNPGLTKKQRTGLELNCSFANFQNGTISRERYLKIMDVCLANAKTPTLVHVNAFKDLPTNEENKKYKFDNLITQEELLDLQSKGNQSIEEFLKGQRKVLFTTKCSRGVDFPGEKCNSIVITRYPYPNVQGLFWKILKEEQPEKFLEFYLDKAKRDLVQKVARGIRFKGDSVELWSPDVRVLQVNFD